MIQGSASTRLNVAILAAGAGGMYCGSCLRDNSIAAALIRAGHHITLVPMYTPLRTEDAGVGVERVFFGGVNVYLQHATRLFRYTPRLMDWLLDRPALLKWAGTLGANTPPSRLGPLTISILKGESGPAAKELRRLVAFLKNEVRPQVVSLPNLMFIGVARQLSQELGVPLVCELTGEDLFLGKLVEPWRSQARAIIRERADDVARFVATSAYYADQMVGYLNIERERIEVVYPGVPRVYLSENGPGPRDHRPPTVGYLARICPEKGFGQLLDAMAALRQMEGMKTVRLIAAGYLGDEKWFHDVMRRAENWAPPGTISYLGEVDRKTKLQMLDSIDVLSVPSVYAEAKGIYVLEALSRGVPVVQPAHGSFPELIHLTGGGVLTPPGNVHALAGALAELLRDVPRRAELGRAGRDAVASQFTEEHVAQRMLECFRDVLHSAQRPVPRPTTICQA